MYKVLIVDDEYSIREGLTHLIRWGNLGFSICGSAGDGNTALEIIEAERPHLVLLDVKMPVMDGITLMDTLKKKDIHCKIIVISGYSEFEYARKALEIGAKTYMLKPVRAEELALQVTFVREELQREEELSKRMGFDLENASENVAINLLTGNSSQIVEKLNAEWHFKLPWKSYQIVATTRDNPASSQDPIREVFLQFCRQHLYCLAFTYGQYVGMLCGHGYLDSAKEALYERIAIDINRVSSKHHTLVAGHTVDTHRNLLESFMKIENVLKSDFLFKNTLYVILETHTNKTLSNAPLLNDATFMGLADSIKRGDPQKLERILENLRDGFVRNLWNEEKIKNTYCELLHQLNSSYSFIRQELSKDIQNTYLEIHRINNISSLHGFIKYKLQSLALTLSERPTGNEVSEVVRYIDGNFTCSGLSLKLLAEKFWYHPTYLGVLLKKHLGKSFNQYLLDLRLGYAKELLEKGDKPSTAAEKAGFTDTEYFRKLFKKTTGASPQKFRKRW